MCKTSRYGSGIWIRDEHPGSYFRELRNYFWVKILKFLDADAAIFLTPGSGIWNGKIRIRDKNPGSATLPRILRKSKV
jgi:hypothetical protein